MNEEKRACDTYWTPKERVNLWSSQEKNGCSSPQTPVTTEGVSTALLALNTPSVFYPFILFNHLSQLPITTFVVFTPFPTDTLTM